MRAKYVSVQHATGVGVAERWREQYCRGGVWTDTAYGSSEKKYKTLVDLGPTPDIDAVSSIIGNKSWSYLSCDGCNQYVQTAVSLGEYEPKVYCAVCIAEAMEVLKP